MVPIIDLVIIIFLSGFVFYGFFFGLIRTVGSIISLALGIWAASHYYAFVFAFLKTWFLGYDTFGRAFAYIVIFIIVNRLAMIGFSVLNSTYNLISIIPFLKTFNRLLGAIFGFLEGSFLMAVLVYFAVSYASLPLVGGWLAELLVKSRLAIYFFKLSSFLSPFLPAIIIKIKSVI